MSRMKYGIHGLACGLAMTATLALPEDYISV